MAAGGVWRRRGAIVGAILCAIASCAIAGGVAGAERGAVVPGGGPPVHHGIHVASWRWEELGVFFTFTTFIVVTGLAKVAFHHAHWLSDHVPESCLMIVVGVSVGGIMYLCGVRPDAEDSSFQLPDFSPRLFFLVLLPPVILESAYSLYDHSFADNLSTILLYAVMGTLWNTFAIGLALWGLHAGGAMGSLPVAFGGLDALVFAALISGVDPVAVLAIFQEVGVNKDLYYLVFGESLFNDAVTVVLYTTMVTFYEMPNIPKEQYLLAALAFFTVSLGGAVVGVLFGLVSALITRTTVHIRVVEPLAVLGLAYLSYLAADLFHFSGIISIIVCGLIQAHYALQNISPKSYTTVKYFTKMVSSTCDAIIFLFLGMELVSDKHLWHTGFVLWVLLLCLLCRFVGVAGLTALANAFRVRPIALQEQFLMGYGGLRGAVAFSLAEMLHPVTVEPRQLFITTTLVVILFTVFIQGSTIKPLVKLLNIRLSSSEQKTLNEELNEHIINSMMAGIEEVTGVRGDFYLQRKFELLDSAYFKKIFTNCQNENSFTKLYEKLLLADHYVHLYGPVALVEDKQAEVLLRRPDSPLGSDGWGSSGDGYTAYTAGGRLSVATAEGVGVGVAPITRWSALFPGVELRQHPPPAPATSHPVSSYAVSLPASPATHVSFFEGAPDVGDLRRALRDNPYQKLHRRYNPNLIDDECQELAEHLERRHLRSRRISQAAVALSRRSTLSEPNANNAPLSPRARDSYQWPKRQIHSDMDGFLPDNLEGLEALLARAERRVAGGGGGGGGRKSSFASSLGADSLRGAQSPALGAIHASPPASPSAREPSQQLHLIREAEDDALLPPPTPPSPPPSPPPSNGVMESSF